MALHHLTGRDPCRRVTVPKARAGSVWLLWQYGHRFRVNARVNGTVGSRTGWG